MTGGTARALTLAGFEVAYGRHRVVEGVDLELPVGEVVGILGPNGSGKSTLIRAVAGIQPHGGTIRFCDVPARRLGRRLGYMPQEIPTEVALTCLESVVIAQRDGFGWGTAAEDVERAAEALDELGIAGLADRYLGECSGGQRQLVSLAQALAGVPEVLLLDEPTSALDLRHQAAVFARVRRHVDRTGALAVAAVHDINLAARHCDRLVMLRAGQVVATGSPEAVLTPEVLEEVYDVPVDVHRAEGRILVQTAA